jgi:3-phosphoshikimate 1-carboxyvinyltransferase
MAERVILPRGRPFASAVTVPGDKSLSHRSLIFGAMAEGESAITGLAPGLDVRSTLDAILSLGVRWDGSILVSPGVAGWVTPHGPIDCGNSGTTIRLLLGALSGRPFTTRLVGDESLSRRPMERVARPLRALGATVQPTADGTAPVDVSGGYLRGCRVEIDVASAQVRSAFELAAVQAEGESAITSPPGYRDHTERMLEAMGRGDRLSATEFRIVPGPIPPERYDVPGDPSSAAFLWASAAVIPGSEVTTPSVSLNPGRLGFLQALEAMGAQVAGSVTGTFHGDVVGDVVVGGADLRAIEVSGNDVAGMIDELPLLAVVAAYADGVTRVGDAGDLRTKESDRIATTVAMIRALGGGAEEADDGFSVVGTGFLEAGTVDSHGDHRIAMAAAVAATGSRGPVRISEAGAASVSWPGFYDALESMWSSR